MGSFGRLGDASERQLVVQVADKKSATSATITIAIADVDETPTAIALGNATIDENAAGAVIGPITVVDPDDSAEPFGQHSATCKKAVESWSTWIWRDSSIASTTTC